MNLDSKNRELTEQECIDIENEMKARINAFTDEIIADGFCRVGIGIAMSDLAATAKHQVNVKF